MNTHDASECPKDYIIMGKRDGSAEEIDTAITKEEADFMVREYRTQLGADWYVWIKDDFSNDDELTVPELQLITRKV